MNVIQNYLLNFVRAEWTSYDIKLFMLIVQHANQLVTGEKISNLRGSAICIDGFNCCMTIPVTAIADNHHYAEMKQAVKRLKDRTFEFVENRNGKAVWHYSSLIENIEIIENSGKIKFTVPQWLIAYIVDFTCGQFSLYDFQLAMSLNSVYAIKLYWLTCSLSHPITYKIEFLRQILNVKDKYKSTKDFLKRCIDPCDVLYKKHKMNGFSYTCQKTGKRITSITLTPIKRQEERKESAAARGNLSAFCNRALQSYLITQCDFSNEELRTQKTLLFDFCKLSDWQGKIIKIAENQRLKRAGKGYIINAMKNCIRQSQKV